jgi:polyhydroxyalkanoate synthesis regulator phasin
MNTQTKSIGEKMNERKAGAADKIKSMLWGDEPDLDQIAATALSGGVAPVDVDAMAGAVAESKRVLAAAVDAEGQSPALTKAATAARTAAAKAERALSEATAAAELARDALAEAEAARATATAAVNAAANLLVRGDVPTDKAPTFLQEIVAQRKATEVAAQKASRIASLTQTIGWMKNRVDGLKDELKKEKGTDPAKENSIPGPAGLIAVQDAIAGRLKGERQRLADAEKELAGLLA